MRGSASAALGLVVSCALLQAAPARASCLAPSAIRHLSFLTPDGGGIDFSGTEYASTCRSGSNGCLVKLPPLRFWEQYNFATANSGDECRVPTSTWCMIHPELDFGIGGRGLWALYKGNWMDPLVIGCPVLAPPRRTVAEVSFCDPVSGDAWYAVASVAHTLGDYNFDDVTGAGGVSGAILPLTVVPRPVPGATRLDDPAPGWLSYPVDLSQPLAWWTELGANDPAHPLLYGYELLYRNSSADPGTTCPSDPSAWLPVRSHADPTRELGVVAPGLGIEVTVPLPVAGEASYLAARVVYAEATARVFTPLGGPVRVTTASSNQRPVALAGGPYRLDCRGGIARIMLDGAGSFDPDAGDVLSYAWTTTCGATLTGSDRATPDGAFDCSTCHPLDCTVTLRVSDDHGAFSEANAAMTSLPTAACVSIGNDLRMVRDLAGPRLEWPAVAAPAYLALRHRDRLLGDPSFVACDPATSAVDPGAPSTGIGFYSVEGLTDTCAAR